MPEAIKLVSVLITIEKQFPNLRLNHARKTNGILPKSLQFSPPIRAHKAYRLGNRFGWQFLNLRISECHRLILKAEANKQKLITKLMQVLTFEDFQLLKTYACSKSKVIQAQYEDRHAAKVNRLIGKTQVTKNIFKQ